MKPIKTLIVVKSQFEGIHRWEQCPYDDVKFLRWSHRHIFHVKLKIEVSHADRDLEFIQVKRQLESLLTNNYQGKNLGSMSCEMIAEKIGMHFIGLLGTVNMVSVSEDEENSAEVYFG